MNKKRLESQTSAIGRWALDVGRWTFRAKRALLLTSGLCLLTSEVVRAADNFLWRDAFQMGAGNASKNGVITAKDNGDGTWTLKVIAVNADGTPIAGGGDSDALTNTELRATPVPVSGPLTDAQMRATAVPVSGPLTDAQLRATAVPVSGTVAVSNHPGTVNVGNFPAGSLDGVNRTATGTITAISQTVAINTQGAGSVISNVSGTWTAVLQYEGTVDGATWFSVGAFSSLLGSTATSVTNDSANQTRVIPCGGLAQVRLRSSSHSSGTATINLAASPAHPPTPMLISVGTATGTTSPVITVGPNDATNPFNSPQSIQTTTYLMNRVGAVTAWDGVRTPAVFKTATATNSGATALWTPTSSKKFRLMRYQIQISADAAISGGGAVLDIVLRDSTTDLAASRSVFVPTAAGTTFVPDNPAWVDLGNGILSAAANNVLNINLSATLTSGKVRVVCAGTEE